MQVHNKKVLYLRRKELRTRTTPEEEILWSRLRKNQLGYKFRRQHSIGWYIVDFYCPEKRLAIEVDGEQHKNRRIYDEERTKYLNDFRIKVLRFWDNQVRTDTEEVVSKVRACL